MKNILQRSITGTIFVLLVLASVLINEYTFGILFVTFTGLALFEFHALVESKFDVQLENWVGSVMGIILFTSMFMFAAEWVDYRVFAIYFVVVCVVFITELYRKKENPVMNWAMFTLGQTYVALPFALLSLIPFIEGKSEYNPILLLAFFVIIWVFDSGAFVVGISIGKHRLLERISPKKSWEGFFGGMIFALATGWIFSKYEPALTLVEWLGFSMVIVIFATFGDLSESLFKRTIGVKDSGNTLPGHGGILDRFDSIFFAAIAICIYLQLLFAGITHNIPNINVLSH